MSATKEFYGSIIRNAGLDECDEVSWARLSGVMAFMPVDITEPVDVFDYAVDALLVEEGAINHQDELTLSPRTLTDAAGLGLMLIATCMFAYALCLVVAR